MADYLFTDNHGNISSEDYNQFQPLSGSQIKDELQNAFNYFPFKTVVSQQGVSDLYDVSITGYQRLKDLVICAKATTPGGRSNITDEQRIQIKAGFLNQVYDAFSKNHNGILLGIYSYLNTKIFCAWKPASSTGAFDTPISKQVKIHIIADAVKEGFVQVPFRSTGTYLCAFRPEFLFFYIRNLSWIHDDPTTKLNQIAVGSSLPDESSRACFGSNILLYGVPGSGKSYTIEHELCRSVKKENRYRVVFHPEYMYSDFVGQILPKVIKSVEEDGRDEVTYEFVPGPFTNILKEAYHNPCEKYVLIIEELNRGNAPAIFGEIFQLLDRIGPNSTNKEGYRRGTSEYFINNENIAECVYGEKTHEVRIPSNLTILATMNTSDQNVFTLDTAFQRRWQMRQVDNSFEKVSDSLANKTILDTTVRWEKFCQEVNNQILINASEMSSTEDKRLGVYFVTEEDLSFNELDYSEEEYLFLSKEDYDSLSEPDKNRLEEITEAKNQNRRFPEKVLKYLWDDAFKFNPDRLFKKELRSLEAVISGFLKNKGNARWNILNEAIKGNLIEDDKGRS